MICKHFFRNHHSQRFETWNLNKRMYGQVGKLLQVKNNLLTVFFIITVFSVNCSFPQFAPLLACMPAKTQFKERCKSRKLPLKKKIIENNCFQMCSNLFFTCTYQFWYVRDITFHLHLYSSNHFVGTILTSFQL